MSARNVLLVALDPVPADQVRTAIAERQEYGDVNVHVVAPATHIGKFQWLTGASDEARADAAELAGVERVDAAEAIREARAEAAVPRSYPQLVSAGAEA
jgi:hypothetical protein